MTLKPKHHSQQLPVLIAHVMLLVTAVAMAASPAAAAQAEEATPEKIKRDVWFWIGLQDFDGSDVNPVVYGERAIPALREVIESPDRYTKHQLVGALYTIAELGLPRPELVPLILPHLLSDISSHRSGATRALAAVGREAVGAVIITQLYDPEHGNRISALRSLGKYGGPDVLPALEIWRHQMRAADAQREHPWLTPLVQEFYDEAVRDLLERHDLP